MNSILFIVTLVVIALLLATYLAALIQRHGLRRGLELFANSALIVNITPKGRGTRLADAAFTSRYLLCKAGSDYSHIAICTASDKPLGVVTDMTPSVSADLTYPLPVRFLGLNEDTERMIASAAIAVDDYVVPAAGGLIKTLPTSGGGSSYVVGRALTAGVASGDQVEIVPCFPLLVTIPS